MQIFTWITSFDTGITWKRIGLSMMVWGIKYLKRPTMSTWRNAWQRMMWVYMLMMFTVLISLTGQYLYCLCSPDGERNKIDYGLEVHRGWRMRLYMAQADMSVRYRGFTQRWEVHSLAHLEALDTDNHPTNESDTWTWILSCGCPCEITNSSK